MATLAVSARPTTLDRLDTTMVPITVIRTLHLLTPWMTVETPVHLGPPLVAHPWIQYLLGLPRSTVLMCLALAVGIIILSARHAIFYAAQLLTKGMIIIGLLLCTAALLLLAISPQTMHDLMAHIPSGVHFNAPPPPTHPHH